MANLIKKIIKKRKGNVKEEPDSREYKIKRFCEFLQNEEEDILFKPTPTAKKIGISSTLFKDLMDFGETYEEMGIKIYRNKIDKEKIDGFIKTDKYKNIEKEILSLKKEILKDLIYEIKKLISNSQKNENKL